MKWIFLLIGIMLLAGCAVVPEPIKVEFYEPVNGVVFKDKHGTHGYIKSIQYKKEKSNVSIFDFTIFSM